MCTLLSLVILLLQNCASQPVIIEERATNLELAEAIVEVMTEEEVEPTVKAKVYEKMLVTPEKKVKRVITSDFDYNAELGELKPTPRRRNSLPYFFLAGVLSLCLFFFLLKWKHS